jgi:hypothetical protein
MPISGKLYVWEERAKYVSEEPGIYGLYDESNTLIYLGKSENLQKTFTKLLDGTFSDDKCKEKTKFYKREFTSTPEERIKELLEEYKKTHGAPPKYNRNLVPLRKNTHADSGFHFYEGLGRPLNEIALSLREFKSKISRITLNSIEFHQNRGDFAKWTKNSLRDPELAESIQKIEETGEELRKALLRSLDGQEEATCPICDTEVQPKKTWKMAGRPSAKGEKLQLTIGLYKCSKCDKSFRHVIAKKKIRS